MTQKRRMFWVSVLMCSAMAVGCSAEVEEFRNTEHDAGTERADVAPDTDAQAPDADTDTEPGPECTTAGGCEQGSYCNMEMGCVDGVCEALLVPEVEPGTMYEAWDQWPCVADSCTCASGADPFLEGILKCEPVHNGYFWTFGSVEVRVLGRAESGECIWEVSENTEAEVTQRTCRVPMPSAPWPGLYADHSMHLPFMEGFPGECDEPTTCCVLDGCPNPCGEEEMEKQVCFRFPLHMTPCEVIR
ncbi:hypothetical protein FRC98_17430 [Lujinxingia vulgaris]|uniref:Uncharacterized protein n=1 Tax=Lujinxingia vulgaris TaxID=2600176 RepID=A0A5C6X1A4_9DELT|nr:hypothetical protein [Lujinxingia vulgaris]TXD34904.1 hypothetical protein FRC98_17430 [Lujinxingia vulgaris]